MTAKTPAKRSDDEIMEVVRAVPQRLVGRMFGGRQTVHLQRMASRWSCPVDAKTVDLCAVMAWLWNFLKKHGPVLTELMDGDAAANSNSPVLRTLNARARKVEAEAEAVEMRNDQKARNTCDVKLTHEFLAKLSGHLQAAAQQAQRQWGREGVEMFNGLQESLREDLRQMLPEPKPSEQQPPKSAQSPRKTPKK